MKSRPPPFAVFVIKPSNVFESCQQFLLGQLREKLDIMYVPTRLLLRGDKVNPFEKYKRSSYTTAAWRMASSTESDTMIVVVSKVINNNPSADVKRQIVDRFIDQKSSSSHTTVLRPIRCNCLHNIVLNQITNSFSTASSAKEDPSWRKVQESKSRTH